MRDPIDRKSLQDSAVDWLREAIVRGAFASGATLTELALTEQIGVGRSTVRSALFALEAQELVVRTPYSSWHVATLDAREIEEIYTLRAALEGLAARIVAQKREQIDMAPIDAAFHALETIDAANSDQRLRADLGFHASTVVQTGHRLLARRHAQLADKMEWLYRWSELHWPRRRDLVEEHQKLRDALFNGSPDDAEQAVRDHISQSITADIEGFHELEARDTKKP
ncbi:GntR family transcriptional regulator [Neorhizobium sp. NCHU2750]|uniref:GntR family transcriptional regulator n=1 Tax=Neorhizobium sp. NCHU2750 TaxID=1825976 RepID=UPI000E7155F9|nr:GntR family transcriptional regulator [Neorhizobium sp. NCHU2750]